MKNINNNNNLDKIKEYIYEKLSKLRKLIERGNQKEVGNLNDEIWELSKKKFIQESKIKIERNEIKDYEGLIFTVGFSPEPIILSILAVQPQAVFFIYTRESEKVLDQIIEETELRPIAYRRGLIPKDSASEAYNLIKKSLEFLESEKNIKRDKIALDPTGGTKMMSVGCGIATTIFNLDLLYINNKRYNQYLRRPEPGSEILINVPNPFDIYQDDKLIEALNYMVQLNFSASRDLLFQMKEKSSNPRIPELLGNISSTLYFWDMIDYISAISTLDKALSNLKRVGTKIESCKDELLEILNGWKGYLQKITDQMISNEVEIQKIIPLLIYDIQKNAERKFYQDEFDNAALKYYRSIEMINQYLLFKNYNFNTQNPSYSEIPQKVLKSFGIQHKSPSIDIIKNRILDKYNQIWKEIYSKKYKDKEFHEKNLLPHKIGLLAGLIYRLIFGDKNMDKSLLLNLFSIIETRNQSIFAHGVKSISKKNCEKIKKYAKLMIKPLNLTDEDRKYAFDQKLLNRLKELFLTII